MNLFDTIHKDLFAVLASPNRRLYADALEVLYEVYCDHLKIPEEQYFRRLYARLDNQLQEANFEDEDIEQEELENIQGRTRFLIRKLHSRGWFDKERDRDFNFYITLPPYSIQLLELFHALRNQDIVRGDSFVYSTFSSLKVSASSEYAKEKMLAVYLAYDNTQSLIKLLKTVYHSIKRFFQLQIAMKDVNHVLAAHFDNFGQQVIEAHIRPLKIKDSVPKYRIPIQNILREWADDKELLDEMAAQAFLDQRGDSPQACRQDICSKLFWVLEQYDRIERDYLDEIDQQIRRYTRATTQKIEALMNRDQNTRGNLQYLLTALGEKETADRTLDALEGTFSLYQQSYLSSRSLDYRRKPRKRSKETDLPMEDDEPSDEMIAQAEALVDQRYARSAVQAYMEERFGQSDSYASSDLPLDNDHDYILSLLAVLQADQADSFYGISHKQGSHIHGPYQIPQLDFVRKHTEKKV